MKNSSIGWTHHTFNAWIGCDKVSDGCKHCYAEADMDKRRSRAKWGKHGTRSVTSYNYWRDPLKWDKIAEQMGQKHFVFAQSLSDTFEDFAGPIVNNEGKQLYWPYHHNMEGIPYFNHPDNLIPSSTPLTLDHVRAELFKLMEKTPNLIWLCLSKRPENMLTMAPDTWANGWPSHVFAGASTENQVTYNTRVKELLKVPAHKHFISAEPLLSNIELADSYTKWLPQIPDKDGTYAVCVSSYYGVGLDWVIVGGESGNKARPMETAWAMNIQRQCAKYNVPFFFKQWGQYNEIGEAVGKKLSGELLDGKEFKQFPV